MVKRKAVLELHAYIQCESCGKTTPGQGKHCMHCGIVVLPSKHEA
jgi:hypothetical protein